MSDAATPGPAAPQPGTAEERESVRARKVIQVVFALFCLEVGLILLLLPWTLLWDNNYFLSLPLWKAFWTDSYIRGAASGLGLLNLWIAFTEGVKLWR